MFSLHADVFIPLLQQRNFFVLWPQLSFNILFLKREINERDLKLCCFPSPSWFVHWKEQVTGKEVCWLKNKPSRYPTSCRELQLQMSTTAPEGTQSLSSGGSGATFAHSHLFRQEEQVQFQGVVLHLEDETGQRAPWLPHPTPAARSTTLGSVAAESSLGWNCCEQSYQLWYERIAAHGADCSQKGPNYLTGFKWSVQRQGACRQLSALFSGFLIHEIACPVEALWLSACKRAPWGTESGLYHAQQNRCCPQCNMCSKRTAM